MTSRASFQFDFSYGRKTYSFCEKMRDSVAADNLQLLANRKPGEIFWADNQHRLHQVGGWFEKAWFWLKNRDGKEQAKVKEAVSWTLEHFNTHLSHTHNQNKKQRRLAISTLFDPENGPIGRMSQAVFDRTIIGKKDPLSKCVTPQGVIRVQIGKGHFLDIQDSKVKKPVYYDIDLGSRKANENLWTLLKRNPDDGLYLDSKGRLKKAHFSVLNKQDKQLVQGAVTQVLSQLSYAMEQVKTDRVHKVVIEHLLTRSPLVFMSRKMYDRGVFEEGSAIEKMLMPDLEEKREKLTDAFLAYQRAVGQAGAEQALMDLEAAFLEHAFFEFKFAQKLGLDLKPIGNDGSGGARIARDRHGHKTLVVKPGDEGPHGVNNPTWFARIKRFFVSPRACLEGNSEEIAEVDSYYLDRCFRLRLVPPTMMRRVFSYNFKGKKIKPCSIQMYVSGCKTLAEHVHFNKKHLLPRAFLRWQLGSEEMREKYMASEIPEEVLDRIYYANDEALSSEELAWKKVLLEKEEIPQHILERFAIGDFASENVDRHLNNGLLKILDPFEDDSSVLSRLFSGKKATRKEVRGFVDHLFSTEGNQRLLERLLYSEEAIIEGERKRVMLVSIDGGSSNPRSHPSAWDFLALRFKHFFEVLPHYQKSFSSQASELVLGKEREFHHFIQDKARRSLENIMPPKVFNRYWENRENKELFENWVRHIEEEDVDSELKDLKTQLTFAAYGMRKREWTDRDRRNHEEYFLYHLERIRDNIRTRYESWVILKEYVQDGKAMRELLTIRSHNDFQRELERLKKDESLDM